jgi:hypothetical protein
MVLNGILGGIGSALGGSLFGGGNNQSQTMQNSGNPFSTNLVITDGDAAYNTMALVLAIVGALAAGSVWTKIWEKTVRAQQTIRWGYGSPQTPYNQGYMWFCSLDTTVDFEHGKLRLTQTTANDSPWLIVKELDDAALHLSTVTSLATATPISKNDMVALPEKVEFPEVGEDSKIQLWYQCIAPATAENNVGFGIPATVRGR